MCVWAGKGEVANYNGKRRSKGEGGVGDGKAAWQLLRQTEGHELLSAYLLQGKRGQRGAGKEGGEGRRASSNMCYTHTHMY